MAKRADGSYERSQGEGAIYKRKDDRWVGAFVVGWRNGKPQKKYVYAKNRRLVAEKLATQQRVHAQGHPVIGSRQTLAQFAVRYTRDVLTQRARNTQSNVRVALDVHILPALGHRRLAALTPGEIAAWLSAEPGAASSRAQYRTVLRRVLAQAVEWGELATNPVDRVRAPRRERVPARFLDPAEGRRVLAVVQDDPWEGLLWLALTLGLRRGELLALQWGDVDWDRAQLQIQRNYTRGEVRVTKSAAGRRVVPLVPPVLTVLDRRRTTWPSVPWIFATRRGGLVDPHRLADWWVAVQARAEISPPATWHSLRHAAGSFLLDLGMPLPQVSRILGHSSVAVTAAIYAHALEGGDRRYVERLGALLTSEAVPLAVNVGRDERNVAE